MKIYISLIVILIFNTNQKLPFILNLMLPLFRVINIMKLNQYQIY